MKLKYTLFLSIFTLFFANGYAQDSLLFTSVMGVNKVYSIQEETTTKGVMAFKGEKEVMEIMKSTGLKSSYPLSSTKVSSQTITTGDYNKDSSINIQIQYGDVFEESIVIDEKSTEEKIESGALIKGVFYKDGAIEVNEVQFKKEQTEEFIEEFKKAFSRIQNQLQVEPRIVKKGDKFSISMPLQLPIGKSDEADIFVKATYKLKKIKSGIGYFDIKQEIVFDSNGKVVKILADGKGKGKGEYVIDENVFRVFRTNLKIKFEAEMTEAITLSANMKIESIRKTIVDKD